MSQNIFEQAARQKVRFQSTKGELTVEQLWDLPLTSKTGFDLATIGKATHRALRDMADESFVVVTKPDSAQARLELQMAIIKHIITVKQDEADEREAAARKAQERERLTEILAKKQDAALESLSVEELQARINGLS